ncbi:MAG: HDIG domain-containing protein, partial [Planctomycetes bacterium]|nr:HDIG domain-containing protein [Planctomycetota bacterium]
TNEDERPGEENLRQAFDQFRTALASDESRKRLQGAVKDALKDLRENGVIKELEHEKGILTEILVYTDGASAAEIEELDDPVKVTDVQVFDLSDDFEQNLADMMHTVELPDGSAKAVADRLFAWLRPQLEKAKTLSWNEPATDLARDRAEAKVRPVMVPYNTDEPLPGIVAGEPLDAAAVDILRKEHEAYVAQLSPWEMFVHSMADFGMYFALYVLCGLYVYYREPRVLKDLRKFGTLLACVVATVVLVRVLPREWLAEITPIVLFAMAVSIAYSHELSLVLASSVCLVASLSLGLGLSDTVIMVATVAPASFLSVRVRHRTKLVYAGLCAGVVGSLTTLGVSTLSGQPVGVNLLIDAALYGMWAIVAGLLMTALLPFAEKLFNVQTDLSLLELGDASHPLLQELVRRAPGTYNHSINVASLCEAAADAIGANGLLVRVGAYFHDIGKMLKPSYFIENQGGGDNRHQSLVPAMSTLVIIAHVKDGVDLAWQHHLPRSIIEFIEQHHGTTLVEYFYREAAKKSEADPDSGEVDEATFRYPGPKPQTKEAAVMMLADACESTSRTLEEPSPARLESLVAELSLKRLMDGQFDDCGITLKELHTVQESLVKTLTAVYHSRVKYSGQQQTA